MRGIIVNFKAEKGFGFIKDAAGVKYFFHISNVINSLDIKENYSVEFTAYKKEKGMVATDISVKTPLKSESKDKLLKIKDLRIRASDIKEYTLEYDYTTVVDRWDFDYSYDVYYPVIEISLYSGGIRRVTFYYDVEIRYFERNGRDYLGYKEEDGLSNLEHEAHKWLRYLDDELEKLI